MNLPQNITTFLKSLPLSKMKGEDIFVAIAYFFAGGSLEAEVAVRDVEKHWSKETIGKKYNAAYSTRAKGRTHPSGVGRFSLTEEGTSYVEELTGEVPTHATTLLVFQPGNAHSFDKFLRGVLKEASSGVDIADTYVAGNLFDTLLDEVPKTIPIRFVYKKDAGGFVTRVGRFATQYKIETKESQQFHDRFLIVDGKGYVVGPSLKDAADKKPATVVALNVSDSKKIMNLFDEIWRNAK
ncbi:MAG: hypothetical protein WD896_01255 [Parcubacteria group bacterium]